MNETKAKDIVVEQFTLERFKDRKDEREGRAFVVLCITIILDVMPAYAGFLYYRGLFDAAALSC